VSTVTAAARPVTRLVLLGGGHSHLPVLQALARRRWPGVQATLVTPHRYQLYTGMLPGWMAGHYTLDACRIDLQPWVDAGGIRFEPQHAVAIDAGARQVRLEDGRRLPYDVLSVDIGSVSACDAIPGAAAHALALRPLHRVVSLWPRVEQAAARGGRVAVVGAGAGGVELAMALRYRLPAHAPVLIVCGPDGPVAGYPARTRYLVSRALQRLGVERRDTTCTEVGPEAIALANGECVPCGAVLLAAGAAAPAWLQGSGLQLSEDGFIATGPTLQSVSHAEVFAAGDVADRVDVSRPRSGVHAVRAGPPLARNLEAWVCGEPLAAYAPQQRSLNLLSCGERYAVASWGRWSWSGRWVWLWKDRIDRAFIARYGATCPSDGR
jgi:selenide,water dikinase